jgi:AcrR family transcriptional regulator
METQMVRPKQGETTLTAEQIKAVARSQMALQGAAGVTLRGIARALGVTAPAIYNYFPRLDDLYTALIVDAYNRLADAVAAGEQACAGQPPAPRLLSALLAYRAWAMANPAEFALIFGTPIPGYHAPAHLTAPAAQRVFAVILAILAEAHQRGELHAPPGQPPLPDDLRVELPATVPPVEGLPPFVVYVGVAGWVRIHGAIMLELFGHTPEMVTDPVAFYRYEVTNLMRAFGLTL